MVHVDVVLALAAAVVGEAFFVFDFTDVVAFDLVVDKDVVVCFVLVGLPEELDDNDDDEEVEVDVVDPFIVLDLDFVEVVGMVVVLVLIEVKADEAEDVLPGLPDLIDEEEDVDVEDDVLEGLDDVVGLLPPFVLLVDIVELKVMTAEVDAAVVPLTLLLFELFTTEVVELVVPTLLVVVVDDDTTTGFPFTFTNFAPQIPVLVTGLPISDFK